MTALKTVSLVIGQTDDWNQDDPSAEEPTEETDRENPESEDKPGSNFDEVSEEDEEAI